MASRSPRSPPSKADRQTPQGSSGRRAGPRDVGELALGVTVGPNGSRSGRSERASRPAGVLSYTGKTPTHHCFRFHIRAMSIPFASSEGPSLVTGGGGPCGQTAPVGWAPTSEDRGDPQGVGADRPKGKRYPADLGSAINRRKRSSSCKGARSGSWLIHSRLVKPRPTHSSKLSMARSTSPSRA
jgi:hypothetical protein